MKLYRYSQKHAGWGPRVRREEFPVIRETDKTYVIKTFGALNGKPDKFVRKTGKKLFAYPTEAAALKSFIARKDRQLIILQTQLDNARAARREAINLQIL